jgi:methionine-rich copper-binding protein CopC
MSIFAKIKAMNPSRRISQSMNPQAYYKKVGALLFGVLLVLLASTTSLAQHGHGVLTPGVTFPPDDSVLTESPQMITMSFRVDVRLLKLALYTADGKWISINFEYDPSRMSHSFVLPIPGELPKSEYYTARWSVTDDRRGLVNGEFNFAFGSGAIPPSETIEALVSDKVESLPSTGSYRYQRETN